MLDCLILGDSIAYGVSNIRKECVAYAKSGINSTDWNDKYGTKITDSKVTIISLGTNDVKQLNTEVELIALRSRIRVGHVYWIMPPIKPEKQAIVRSIAKTYGDSIIKITELSTDKIHPTYNGYKKLGEAAR
jgi:lysophospholipase L1-like esterase